MNASPEAVTELLAMRDKGAEIIWPERGLWFDRVDTANGRRRCSICGDVPREHLVYDHCHATGLHRGQLCRSCNNFEGRTTTAALEVWRLTAPMLTVGRRSLYGDEGLDRGLTKEQLMTWEMPRLLAVAAEHDRIVSAAHQRVATAAIAAMFQPAGAA